MTQPASSTTESGYAELWNGLWERATLGCYGGVGGDISYNINASTGDITPVLSHTSNRVFGRENWGGSGSGQFGLFPDNLSTGRPLVEHTVSANIVEYPISGIDTAGYLQNIACIDNLLIRCESGNARNSNGWEGHFWLGDLGAIEGNPDMPWLDGITGSDDLVSKIYRNSPFNWPSSLTKNVSFSLVDDHVLCACPSPGAWLSSLGLTKRPTPQQGTPDNSEYFNYATVFGKSLKSFANLAFLTNSFDIPQTSLDDEAGFPAACAASARWGTGSSTNSYADAVSRAITSAQSSSYASAGSVANAVTVQGSNYGENHWSATVFQVAQWAASIWNLSDLIWDLRLFAKTGSLYYNYGSIPPLGEQEYQWATIGPLDITPDGTWHEITEAAGSVAPGQMYTTTISDGTIYTEPNTPPSLTTINYGGVFSAGMLLYWVVTPRFNYLAV